MDNFVKAFDLLPQLIEKNYFDQKQIDAIQKCNDQVEFIDNQKLHQLDDLKNHPEWEKVRKMAKETLLLLGVSDHHPELLYEYIN